MGGTKNRLTKILLSLRIFHQHNCRLNEDANIGHAFGILMTGIGTLHSLRSQRRRLIWVLGFFSPQT